LDVKFFILSREERFFGTHSNFSPALQPGTNVLEGVNGALRPDSHGFFIVLTEELMAFVGCCGVTSVFA